ncbi:hypothetical protein [Massiliimalia massiliensis]|uniref:hypothetical protein n=1 Tax=Massiliimalia massiliensis TaxID=1852384 RepID=UPI000985E02B|nr:hypothetical protein [Massiliimalia massiliensis]
MFDKYFFDEYTRLFEILRIEKIVFDHTGEVIDTPIDSDYLFSLYYEAMLLIPGQVEHAYKEDYDDYLCVIEFSKMEEFYYLCRKWSKMHGVPFKKNPFVVNAEEFVNNRLNYVSYSIGWRLCAPKKLKKKMRSVLLIELSPDFYEYADLLQAVYDISDFFENSLKNIKLQLTEAGFHHNNIIQERSDS